MEKETKKIFIGGNMLTGAIDAVMSNGHQCAITLNENGGFTIEYSDKNIRYLNNQIHNLENELRRLNDEVVDKAKEAEAEKKAPKGYYEWISVEKELPEYNEKVLVTSTKYPETIFLSWREDVADSWNERNSFRTFEKPIFQVTHFMRIKKVYEV